MPVEERREVGRKATTSTYYLTPDEHARYQDILARRTTGQNRRKGLK